MQIIEQIKSHPKLAVAGVVGFLVLVYIINHSSSNTSASSGGSVDGSSVAAATAIQQAQMQANAQANQVNAAVSANATNTAAQLELGKLQIANSGAHDVLAAQVATSQINATQQVQSLLGALSADVAKTNSNNQTAIAVTQSNNTVAMQQILANALVTQSTNQANVAIAGYDANAAAYTTASSNALQASISHDEHSGGLFGGGGFLGLGI